MTPFRTVIILWEPLPPGADPAGSGTNVRHFPESTLMRRFTPIALVALLAACPTYDAAKYVRDQDGLMSADEYAKYGPEQAIAMAIGREFAQDGGAAGAVEYAKKFPTVKTIEVDSLGNRLVVHFVGGWRTQVTPITDGKRGDDTAGL